MGVLGIILLVGSISIGGYIIMDTYLGSPPKPRTLIVTFLIALAGSAFIYSDYYYEPEIVYITAESNQYIYIKDSNESTVARPIRIRVYKKFYPWFIVLRPTRMYARLYHFEGANPVEVQIDQIGINKVELYPEEK